jgi:diguanylate cyclase (GGDEF)-like protein
MTSASRYVTVEDVFVRVIMVALIVSIAAGLTLQLLSNSSAADKPLEIALYAYLIGSIGGFIIAAPLVHTFMVAKLKLQIVHDVDQILREDRLTGLLNRQEFFGQITRHGKAIPDKPCFFTGGTILLIDVDGLQHINDAHGNSIGDTVLVSVSSTIRNSLRDIDFVSRIAGDEFAVFLPAVSADRALEIADRIRCLVSETQLQADATRLCLRVSIGAVPVSRNSAVCLSMKSAEDALHEAKQRGKNCVVLLQPALDRPIFEHSRQAA